MGKKTSRDAVESFESTFQDKLEIPASLELQWFRDALAELELETSATGYDEVLDEFPANFPQYKIRTIGLMMKRSYCERELSRINKIINIVGKDISMTGSGDQKKMTKEELEFEQRRISELIHKQKQHCFA